MQALTEQNPQEGSQTQPETQFVPDSQDEASLSDMKRKSTNLSNGEERAFKKIKVSIGPAVDLGD